MSSTRLLVLGVVRIFQPVHGYDVRRELLSWRAEEWANVAPGSIYSALKTLHKDGLLRVAGTGAVSGRPERTMYRLTPEGEKEFQTLLRESFWRVRPPLDPFLPALCFMPALRRDELIAALRHRLAQIEGIRAHSEFELADLDDATSPPHVRELHRLMWARVESEVAWAQALIARLEAGDYDAAGEPRKWMPDENAEIPARMAARARAERALGRAAGARRGLRPTRARKRT